VRPAVIDLPVNFHSVVPHTTGNQGWTTVETVLIKLNTSYTPSGRFPVYSEDPHNLTQYRLGYDAAICVQRYEPWIIEAYNTSTGSSSALRVVGKGNSSASLLPGGNLQGDPIANTWYLNTTGKDAVFSSVHQNSMDQMLNSIGCNWSQPVYEFAPFPMVGPISPQRTAFLLTSAYSAGCLSHRRY